MGYYSTKEIILNCFDNIVDADHSTFAQNEGLYFIVQISNNNYGFENDGNTRHKEWANHAKYYLHIIILKARRVFTAITNSEEMPELPEWKNTSNHDSCFRHDGLQDIFTVGAKVWEEAWKNTPDEHKECMKMTTEYKINHGWLSGPLFKCVGVIFENDYKTDESGYFKKLTDISIIKKTITI